MRILKIESLPSVKEGWVDRDVIMLHACFQILKDCVEQEGVLTHCDYSMHKESIDEVKSLYDWWIERIKLNELPLNQDEIDSEMLDRFSRLIKVRGFYGHRD